MENIGAVQFVVFKRIYEDIAQHEEHLNSLTNLSEEILSWCHPNAVQTIEQRLSLVEAHWFKVGNI